MSFKLRNRKRIIIFYCIGWIIAFAYLSVIRGVGTKELGSVEFDFWESAIVSVIFGIIFGFISAVIQIITEEKLYRSISFRNLLLLRIVFALLFLTILILASYAMVRIFFNNQLGFVEFAFEPGSLSNYFYLVTVDFFLFSLRLVILMLGEKNLGKLLSGKFYSPREEERVFMFLDLRSSTQLAEKLGHIRYSRLIQDCFSDLGVVMEYSAEIYQYVGDEAILTWELEEGIRDQNCIRAFYSFKKTLLDKTEYYKKEYDCDPQFKAGLHAGIVTVTEVGKYKKDIAYHGDTINTAARIQAKCNEFGKEILISEKIINQLNSNEFEIIGKISLRGKEKEVTIYSVAANSDSYNRSGLSEN